MTENKTFQKKLILITSNNEKELEELSMKIQKLGFGVITANSGNEALRHFEECAPDMIIIDRELKKISGIQLLFRLFFNHPGTKLVLTSNNSDTNEIKIRELDSIWIIKKPISFQGLKQVLQKANLRSINLEIDTKL
jgi:DNA-binding response OmpR family regulator